MDAHDLFKKLSVGTKFDMKRFRTDAQRFQLAKRPNEIETVKVKIEKENDGYSEPTKRLKLEDANEKNIEIGETEETTNALTLIDGMTVPQDGSKIKIKKQKKAMTEQKIMQLEQEKINQTRNQNRISVVGRHAPPPIESFSELSIVHNVAQDLIKNLKTCGYEQPTPIQMQAIPIMLQNRQLLACAPTGSGKTAAFLLPIIHHLGGPQKKGFRAVVVCPTRELAKQTYRECLRLSEGRDFRIHIISKINQALTKYGPNSSQKYDILITTPNRLVFLLNQEPPAISLNNVEWLIVDEADKLFEDGVRGFRDQLDQISVACTNSNLRRAMFSATNTPAVTKWCRHNLKGLINVTVGQRNAATELVEQELLFVGSERGKLVAFRDIIQKGMSPPVLVFVQSKERAQELFNELIYDGINVDVIHADRTQTQRDNVVRCFREGKIWVLICTELMGRGIDFKGVNLVINYDFPPSAISYIHRIGRTGRAGHKGKALTFFTQDDTANLRSIAAIMRESGCEVPEYMLAMKKHSKKEKRKMEREAPKRDSISTIPTYEKQRREKQQKRREGNNRAKESQTVESNGDTIKENTGNKSESLANIGKKKISRIGHQLKKPGKRVGGSFSKTLKKTNKKSISTKKVKQLKTTIKSAKKRTNVKDENK